MTRKTSKSNQDDKQADVELTDTNQSDTKLPDTEQPDVKEAIIEETSLPSELPTDDKKEVDETDSLTVLLSGLALKLSPKTQQRVTYEIAESSEDNSRYFRLSANEGGGLHSKEWISLNDILNLLLEHGEQPFKSLALKPLFNSGSANNTGFLAAALRELKLLIPSDKSVFLHVVSKDIEELKDKLLNQPLD